MAESIRLVEGSTALRVTTNVATFVSLTVALIAGALAVYIHFLGQRSAARERKREACAKALGDALSWMEMPYRVRRRTDDSSDTLNLLVKRMNDLQEALNFHESWLRIEVPEAYPSYGELLVAIRDSVGDPLREAWEASPASSSAEMNIGDLGVQMPTVHVSAFAEAAKKALALRWPGL